MPTNCKGQDKPRQSRGYRAARDTDRGARGSPGRRGCGAGRGLGCCLHPAPCHPPHPADPQSSQHGAAAQAGHPCGSRGQHQRQARRGLTAGYACVGVTGGGSRMAATSRAGQVTTAAASRAWLLREGSCKTRFGVQMRLSCPPSAVPPRPAPKGTAAIPLHSPRPRAPLTSTLSWSPSTAEGTTPGARGAREPWAASTARMLLALPANA